MAATGAEKGPGLNSTQAARHRRAIVVKTNGCSLGCKLLAAGLSITSAAASAGVGVGDFTLSASYLPADGFVDAHVATTNFCGLTDEHYVEMADGFVDLRVIMYPYCIAPLGGKLHARTPPIG